jgi:hypothetical protein
MSYLQVTSKKLPPIEWFRTDTLTSGPEWSAYSTAEGWTAVVRGPSMPGNTAYHWEFIGNSRTYSQRVLPHEPYAKTLALAIAAVKKARERWVRQRRAEVGPSFGLPKIKAKVKDAPHVKPVYKATALTESQLTTFGPKTIKVKVKVKTDKLKTVKFTTLEESKP